MTQHHDSDLHRLLEALQDIEPSLRADWLARAIPDDPELRVRLLQQFTVGTMAAPRVEFGIETPDDESLPAQIGRYRIERPLGAGGMGRVYLAHDEQVRRNVALKVLRHNLDSQELEARFRREVQAAGRLNHPGIVTIFDVLDHQGRPCIVMEYIEGRTMFDVIEARERLPLARKLEIIEQVCAAVGHAHRKDIIHRDLKPANIILPDAGGVKVLDFGIAKVLAKTSSIPDTLVTSEHSFLGTPAYSSPEQLLGQPASPRSDIFSTSVVAYEFLTYTRPFGTIASDLRGQIIRGEVRPFTDCPLSLPEEVERAILKGLAPRPDDRFEDMTAMQRAFAEARAKCGQITPFPNPRPEPAGVGPRLVAALGVAALLVATAAGWMFTRGTRTEANVPAAALASDRSPDDDTSRARAVGRGADRASASTAGRAGSRGNVASPRSVLGSGDDAPLDNADLDEPIAEPRKEAVIAPAPEALARNSSESAAAAPLASADSPPSTKEDDAAIQHALRMFEAAFENRSTPQLTQVYPKVPRDLRAGLERDFLESESYSAQVLNERVAFLSGERARVDATLRRAWRSNGQPHQQDDLVRMELEKKDSEWTITSIRGPNWH